MRAELDAGARKMSTDPSFVSPNATGPGTAEGKRAVPTVAVADVAAIGRAMEAARRAIDSEGPLSTAERAVRECAALVNAAVGAHQ